MRLVLFIVVAECAGILGIFFTGSIDTWYVTLAKPFLNPPSWIFGPMWTLLYALMGSAAYLVWKKQKEGTPLRIYCLQLGVNALWTPIFFGLQNPEFALIDIGLLLILIISTIVLFTRVDKRAGLLLVPYLLWVGFATYLNAMIAFLN